MQRSNIYWDGFENYDTTNRTSGDSMDNPARRAYMGYAWNDRNIFGVQGGNYAHIDQYDSCQARLMADSSNLAGEMVLLGGAGGIAWTDTTRATSSGGFYTNKTIDARASYDGPTCDTTTRLATMQFVRDSSGGGAVADSDFVRVTAESARFGQIEVGGVVYPTADGNNGEMLTTMGDGTTAWTMAAGSSDSSWLFAATTDSFDGGGLVKATKLRGALTGNVTGNVAGTADSAGGAARLGGYAASAYRRLAPRTCDTASTATPTPNCDSIDQYNLTALAADATYGAPTGTPHDGQRLLITIVDDGTARALTWASGAGGYQTGNERVVLPTTTLVGYRDRTLFLYTEASGMWECLAHSLSEVTP